METSDTPTLPYTLPQSVCVCVCSCVCVYVGVRMGGVSVDSLGGAFQTLTPAAMATDVPPQHSNLQEGGMPTIW